jgi:hypothetical protein
MRYLAPWLLIAASLSACQSVAVTPVNHACAVNTAKGQSVDSGCNTRG